MFLINLNAEIVACVLFRKSRHKPNLENTSKYGFSNWRRSEHAHTSYPGLFFRSPGFSPYMGREERRVRGLDYISVGVISTLRDGIVDSCSGELKIAGEFSKKCYLVHDYPFEGPVH